MRKKSVLAGSIVTVAAIALCLVLWQTVFRSKPVAESPYPVCQFVDPEADEEFFRRTIEKYEGEILTIDTGLYANRMFFLGVTRCFEATDDNTLIKLADKQIDKRTVAYLLYCTGLYAEGSLGIEEYDLTPDDLEYYLYGRDLDEKVDEGLQEKVDIFWANMRADGQPEVYTWWSLMWDVENYNKTAPTNAQIDLDNLDEVLAAAQEHGWRY